MSKASEVLNESESPKYTANERRDIKSIKNWIAKMDQEIQDAYNMDQILTRLEKVQDGIESIIKEMDRYFGEPSGPVLFGDDNE